VKVVDAKWERRNLGVESCIEIDIEDLDSDAIALKVIDQQIASYIVVKLPVARFDLLSKVETMGYHFIEASVNLVCGISSLNIDSSIKRMEGKLSLDIMNNSDQENLFQEIHKGMFTTDRVYLDTFFRKEAAFRRYEFWIKDEMERGGTLYKCLFNQEVIGFILMKGYLDGSSIPLLVGVYPKYKDWGLGCGLISKLKEVAVRETSRAISVIVSSNNIPVINIYTSLGFKIKNIKYVLIKHQAMSMETPHLET